jgi:CRP-like cAMP-binding protein
MPRDPEESRLARLPLFRGAAPDRLVEAARHAGWVRAAAGRTIIDYNDASDEVYLIVSGTVRVAVHSAAGQEVILGDLGAGEIFGEMAAIDGAARSANVTAVHNAELCALPRQAFLDLVLGDPAPGLFLLRRLVERLRLLDTRNVELAVLPVRQRLIAELLRLGRPREDGALSVSPPPVQHVLAARIGARREAVSRELAQLGRDGLAVAGRQSILLPAPEALRTEMRAALTGQTPPRPAKPRHGAPKPGL